MEIRTRLVNYMKELGDKDLCVAFSGGVDSSVILRAACEAATANGKKVYAVTFETKLHPKADLPQAQKVAKEAGAIHHVIYVNELDNEEMLNNPVNRCYLCKKYLFQNLLTFAAEKVSIQSWKATMQMIFLSIDREHRQLKSLGY